MARINLLPWREELRQERQRKFLIYLAGMAMTGVMLVVMAGAFFDQKMRHQQMRNDLIRGEIRKLDERIERISELEHIRSRLVQRKQIIEQLQASRFTTVELLDKLAKTVPAGVTLGTVRQQGINLAVTGTSQSNARVSAYLKGMAGNTLFLDPQLEYVRSINAPGNATEPYQFSIRVTLRSPGSEDMQEDFYPAGDDGDSA